MLDGQTTIDPEISIIIRVKNEEEFIGKSLDVVFSQQIERSFEVIVVYDDTSTDQTYNILKKYPVRVIRLQDHIPEFTMSKAWNVGIKHAEGDILVFLSGDAEPDSNTWLANLTKSLVERNVAACSGKMTPRPNCNPMEKRRILSAFPDDRRRNYDFGFHNAAIKRDILQKYPLNEELNSSEDRDFRTRVLSAGHDIVYEPAANVMHSHAYSARRNFTLGLRRGDSHNKQGVLKPQLSNARDYIYYFIGMSPRIVKQLFIRIVKDYAFIYKEEEKVQWYIIAWPYELAFLFGYYFGPLYYRLNMK